MKSCYVFNAGCVRRGLDCIRIQKYLQMNGWHPTDSLRNAALIVIATCGVVQINEESSIKAIEKALAGKSRHAKVIVTGCLPNIHPEAMNGLGELEFVATKDIEKIDRIVDPQIPFRDVKAIDSVMDSKHITNYLIARSYCRRSRLYRALFHRYGMNNFFLSASVKGIKIVRQTKSILRNSRNGRIVPYCNIAISRGCLSNCAFCATKSAIGNLHSRPQNEIEDEFKAGLRKGYRVFQLIAEDTGCYGLDIGTTMPRLLRSLCACNGRYGISIIDYHPRWLIRQQEEMLPLLFEMQEKIKQLFIPIQSGSDRVLSLMKRDHTVAELKPLLQAINAHAPRIELRTSFLVGFPGETREDFEASVDFIKDIKFAEVTVNRYEDRPTTESLRMANKVDQTIIESRAHYLAEHLNCHILS